MRVLTTQQVRRFDQIAIEQFGIPSLVLMENAARGACDELKSYSQRHAVDRSAVILCGSGNNGGDGLAMARHLHICSWKVKVVLFANASELSQDAASNLRILTNTRIPIVSVEDKSLFEDSEKQLAGYGWIIDALLGTGAKPPLRQPIATWVQVSNQMSKSKRMAIDIPSGLFPQGSEHSDESASNETDHLVFNADLTVTFVAAKPILLTKTGKTVCGETKIVDIGAPPEVYNFLESEDSGD